MPRRRILCHILVGGEINENVGGLILLILSDVVIDCVLIVSLAVNFGSQLCEL